MLVLSRKVGERILIGDQIAVTIVRVTGGGVRVGIEAPPDMAVLRAEIKAAADEAAMGNGESTPAAPGGNLRADSISPIVVKPAIVEAVDPPEEVPPVRKPR